MGGVSVRGLTKRYRGDTVLDGVSFEVPEGGTLALFGPSGAGKTVLLRCIAGAVELDAGTIALDGADMTGVPPEDRGVGMAFQNFALFPHMTAFDNIASPLTAARRSEVDIRAGVEDVARLLKIAHVLTHYPRALSNGQKQRTALARALVASPKVLLLDDPLRNVDAKLRFEMRIELPRLLARQGATAIYVTQDYKEAMALGDTIAVLSEGKIAQVGAPEDIYFRPATVRIAQLFGDPSINLLDVTPERDAEGPFVRISDRRVALPAGLASATGRASVLGLRPESLEFVGAGDGFEVTVEAETPFNEKTVTLATTRRGREILISRPSGAPGPGSERAHVAIDGGGTSLFDRATGRRIGAGEAGAATAEAT